MRGRVCQVEGLETRELLSALPNIRPSYEVLIPSANPGPTTSGYTPSQIQQAYQFNQVSDNGSGETIAIVDAYNDPNLQSDLATFDGAYGLAPPPSFTVVNQTGGTTLPAANSGMGRRGVARRRMGARDGARGEHHPGRGQLDLR